MADSLLTELYKKLINKVQPIAYDRAYKYPIYDSSTNYHLGGIDGFYQTPRPNVSQADKIGPAVVINGDNSPRSFHATPNESVMDWILNNKSSAPATLAHERVHHIQTQEKIPPLYDLSPRSGEAFYNMMKHSYGDAQKETHAFALSDTANWQAQTRYPESGTTADAIKSFEFTYPGRGILDEWGGTSSVLDRGTQLKLQQELFNKLSDKAKAAMLSRQSWLPDN